MDSVQQHLEVRLPLVVQRGCLAIFLRESLTLIGVGQQKSRIAGNGLVIAGSEPLRLALLVGRRPHEGLDLIQLQ